VHPVTSDWPTPASTAPGLYATHPTSQALNKIPGSFCLTSNYKFYIPTVHNTWPLFPVLCQGPSISLEPQTPHGTPKTYPLAGIKTCSRSSYISPQKLHGVSHHKFQNTFLIHKPVTHFYTRAHTHTHTHLHTFYTHTHLHTFYTHTHTHTHLHTFYTHTHTSTYLLHTHTHTHLHTFYTHTDTHTPTYLLYTYTYIYIPSTHTHTHTHTHTPANGPKLTLALHWGAPPISSVSIPGLKSSMISPEALPTFRDCFRNARGSTFLDNLGKRQAFPPGLAHSPEA